jgi:hypothetical protein
MSLLQPFTPDEATCTTLSASGSAQSVPLDINVKQVMIFNNTNNIIYVRFSSTIGKIPMGTVGQPGVETVLSPAAATVANDYPIGQGKKEVLTKGGQDNSVSIICTGGATGSVFVQSGEGWINLG